jgi:CRISPR-associated endonuclease Csn1
MTLEEQDHSWEIKINAVDPEKTKAYLKKKWSFADKQVEDFFNLNLSKDYASLSTTAIRNILPFLEKGKLYNDAVILSGIKNAFGKLEWEKMPESEHREIEDTIEGMLLKQKGTKILDRVKEFLWTQYNLSDKQLSKLYHHSEVDEIETTGIFPESDNEIEKIKNPVVMASLFEVRKLVTLILKTYGSPDEVRIEMARELKSGKKKREEMRFKQFDNERANDDAKKELDRYNKSHTRTNIRKILLYKELEKASGQAVNPYNPTQTFNISKLFEDGYVQLEHIIPYSVSLDDSINNLTLCDAKTNGEKGDRTPFQYLTAVGADWTNIKSNIFKLLPYQKAKKFVLESNPSLDDFIQRQLNDTRYISRFAKEYLKYVCPKVYITQGAVTSQLRHLWGLDSLLNKIYTISPTVKGEYCAAIDETGNLIEESLRKWEWSEGDKINKKNEEDLKKIGKVIWGNARDGKFHPFKTRDDHRHHTVDAITIACTKTAFLQEISRLNSRVAYNEYIQRIADFPEPWPGFYQEARNKISCLLVSYKKDKKILTKTRKSLFDKKTGKPLIINGKRRIGQGLGARGELHEATYYGKRRSPGQEKHSYHIRRRLDELTPAMIGKIVDDNVRTSVIEAIRKVNPQADITSKGFKIPDGAFFERKEDGTLVPKVFLPNKNGNPVPIYRVRIRENKSNAVGIKDYNIWVEPGSNHHIVIYSTGSKREGIVVPFWDAVESKKQSLPVVNSNVSGQFIMSLQKGDMVLLDVDESLSNEEINQIPDLHKKLYYLRKMSQKEKGNGQGYQIELVFVHHSISDINPDKERKRTEVQGRSPNTLKGVKVEVSSLGKLKRF